MAAHKRQKKHGPIEVGERVRAKTTGRTGEVVQVETGGPEGMKRDQITVSYDEQPQDGYLTTPAREGAALPPELVDRER